MTTRPIDFDAIPGELKERPQCCCWRHEIAKGKPTKIPYRADGRGKASSTNPATWATFDAARAAYESSGGRFSGIGFVFTADDPYFGVDLDDCIGDDGKVSAEAQAIIDTAQTYCEVSPSGRGVKMILRVADKSRLPHGSTLDVNSPGLRRIEVYPHGRYFALTGWRLPGTPTTIETRQEAAEALYRRCEDGKRQKSNQNSAPALRNGKADPRPDRMATAIRWMNECPVPAAENDGSRRLIAVCAKAIKAGLDEREAIAAVRCYELGQPFPVQYSDDDIARRYRDSRADPPPPRNNGTTTPRAETASTAAKGERRRFNHTDLGNAERLIDQHGIDLRYIRAWNKWLVWDGKRYLPDETGEVERMMGGVVRGIYSEAASEPDENRRKELARHASASESRARIEAALALGWWQPGIAIIADDLDRDPMILNTPTGIVALRSGALRPASRADLCTKLTGVGYDPAAECPTFDRFLQRIFDGKPAIIDYLQRLAGYCATGEVAEQILALAVGIGRNGKTTLFDIIGHSLGEYASKAAPDLLTLRNKGDHPTSIADLCGKRLVVISEVDDSVRWNESRMKELTGETRIKARVMRGDFFEFPATHKLIVFGNSRPVIRGTDLGTWRRMRLIPFDVVIPEAEVDPRLPDKLRAESAGVLRWIVDGSVRWHADGLKAPSEVRQATAQYRVESDTIGAFIEECCIEGVGQSCGAGELFKAYVSWCESGGERPVTQNRFGRTLEARGFGKVKDPQSRRIERVGIGLAGVE